jgi:hypothetical protein
VLLVVAALAVLLLPEQLTVEQAVAALGAVCVAAALTGVVVATGRGGTSLLRAVNALTSTALTSAAVREGAPS